MIEGLTLESNVFEYRKVQTKTHRSNEDMWVRLGPILLYFITFTFGLIFALKLHLPTTIDEVATLSNAAYLKGEDWSETLYALGGYYFKYGPAVLYYPLMALISNPYTLYKAILILNVALYALIPVFAYCILKEFFRAGAVTSFVVALSGGVFPSTVLYTLYARADALLIFLPWPIMYIILELMKVRSLEEDDLDEDYVDPQRGKAATLSILLAFFTAFSYACHTRGIVIILTVLLTILLARTVYGKKTISPGWFIPSLIIFLVADKYVSGYFYKAVYEKYGTGFSSVESYDFRYLLKIFTGDGAKAFLRMILGTAYNVIVSSYGLVIVGVSAAIIALFKKDQGTEYTRTASVFAAVLFLGAFAMSCIYFFPYSYPYERVVDSARSDWLCYGRYTACALGPVTLLALFSLCRGTKYVGSLTRGCTFMLYSIIAGLFILIGLPYMNGVTCVTRNMIQLCTFLKVESYGVTTAVFENLAVAVMQAGALGLIVLILILAAEKTGWKRAGALIFIVMSVTITCINYNNIRVSRDSILTTWTVEPTKKLLEVQKAGSDYPILVDTSAKDIKHYQYALGAYVCGRESTAVGEAENYFVITKKGTFRKSLYDNDFYVFDDYDYENPLKDVVFVKGEELYEVLTHEGYALSPYTGKLKK